MKLEILRILPTKLNAIAEKFIDNIGIQKDKLPKGLENFIKKRVFDSGLSKQERAYQGEKNNYLNPDGLSYDNSSPRKPLQVFSSWTVPWLQNTYTTEVDFDIHSLFEANQVSSKDPTFFGDRLLRDVSSSVLKGLKNNNVDFCLVRIGGDEFKVMTNGGDKEEIKKIINESLKNTSFLTVDSGSKKVSQVSVEIKNIPKGKRPDFSNENKEVRIQRLKKRHKEFKDLLKGIDLRQKNNQKLLQVLESLLFDTLLEEEAREKEKIFNDGTKINLYKDHEDFFEHLSSDKNNEDYTLIRAEVPGLLKYIDDNIGYEKGDELIKKIFNHLTSCFHSMGIKNINILRRGGDFIIAMPSNQMGEEKVRIFFEDNLKKMFSKYVIQDGDELPQIPVYGVTGLSFSGTEEKNKIKVFNQAFDRVSEDAWNNTILILKSYYYPQNEEDRKLSSDDWRFLAYYFSPYEKRGKAKIFKLKIKEDVIKALRECYQNEDDKWILDTETKKLELYKNIMLFIFKNYF
jgi:GGDEF domain-containing protein